MWGAIFSVFSGVISKLGGMIPYALSFIAGKKMAEGRHAEAQVDALQEDLANVRRAQKIRRDNRLSVSDPEFKRRMSKWQTRGKRNQ